MKKCYWVREVEIKYKSKTFEKDIIKIDAKSYLKIHLDCESDDDLYQKLSVTTDDDLLELSEYAASYCSYMHNELSDSVLGLYQLYAQQIGTEESDFSSDFYDDFSYKLKNSYFLIDERML